MLEWLRTMYGCSSVNHYIDHPVGIHSPACRENNEVCSKLGASLIIKSLLGHPIDPQQVPEQNAMYGLNTVAIAQSVPAVENLAVETVS